MPTPSTDFDANYQTVAERIAIFRQKHPEGSLRPFDPVNPFRIVNVGGRYYIAMVAAAFRTPTDPAPGVGSAWFPVPSEDEYTFNVELQRVETASWGRAIIAALAADATKIASADEVRIAQASRAPQRQPAPAPQPEQAPAAEPQASLPSPDNAQSVPQRIAPQSTDPLEMEYRRALVKGAIATLLDPKTTYDRLRDLWSVVAAAEMLAHRIEPVGGMTPDVDGMVPLGEAIKHVGSPLRDA